MAWHDDIAEQRKTFKQEQDAKKLHTDNISAVTESGKGVESATNKLAKTEDIDSLIAQVKEVQLASLLGASKPSIVLTDQTDLGDKMGEYIGKIETAIKQLDATDNDKQQLTELKSLYIGLTQLKSAFLTGNKDVTKALATLTKAVQGIDVQPVVNVPAANVTVPLAKVDLKPLQKTIEQYMAPKIEEKGVDLECYRAQDITDSGNMQYVGFVNPEGAWYIIENDVKGNSMRYLFGTSGYAEAFAQASTYQYKLLNEAINAL